MLVLFLSLFCLAQPSTPSLLLQEGEERVFKTSPLEEVYNSNSQALIIKDLENKIQIIARKKGKAFLRIGKRRFQILVLSPQSLKTYNLFKKNFSFKGLKLEISDTQDVVIRGTLLRFSDWLQISHLFETQSASYKFQAKISEFAFKKAKVYFQNYFENLNSHLHFTWKPQLRVTHSPTSEEKIKVFQKQLSVFGLISQLDKEQLSLKPMVRVKVKVVEIDEKSLNNLGVQWPLTQTVGLNPLSINLSHLEGQLQTLAQQGKARTLTEPEIITASGEEAELLVGGAVAYRISSHRGKNPAVKWKKHGISLKIKPQANSKGHIILNLKTEISIPDFSQTVYGNPSFKTTSSKSTLHMRSSQTLALSQLFQLKTGSSSEGLPFLSRIPILGALFSSKNFLAQKSKLVIFVTPILETPLKKLKPQETQVK